MAKTVTVGCKLPHGIILENPLNVDQKVTLKGLNSSPIIGATHGATEVDAEFWATWEGVNKDFPALKSGAIFMAKNSVEVAAVATEFAERETGFEPMRKDGKDKRAAGVKTNDAKE